MIKQKNNGQLIVISGPSGTGKGTIVKKLLENENRWLSVSATTREPRKGEVDGIDYYFLTKKDFKKKIKEDYFLEYDEHLENIYGTPKEYIKEKLNNGIDVILEIEINGAKRTKELVPEAILIFILPPSIKELARRLKERGTEDNEKLLKRFNKTYKEINEVSKYNYVVINDTIDNAVNKIESIITAEKCSVNRIEEVFLDTKEEEIHELLMNLDYDNTSLGDRIE